MTRARCVRDCIWRGRYWNEGEVYEGAATPPDHFDDIDAKADTDPGTAARAAQGPRRAKKRAKEDGA